MIKHSTSPSEKYQSSNRQVVSISHIAAPNYSFKAIFIAIYTHPGHPLAVYLYSCILVQQSNTVNSHGRQGLHHAQSQSGTGQRFRYPFYHVISRCVRRTFLCGQDRATGRCYEHRRGWIEERIRLLASVFAVDVAAYAVMSNHYHLVVKLSPDDIEPWSMDEVLARWCSLYKGPPLVQRYHRGDELCAAELRRGTL